MTSLENKRRLSFQSKFAIALSLCSLLLLAALAVLAPPDDRARLANTTKADMLTPVVSFQRHLDDNNNNDDSTTTDYSSYSCNDIYNTTQDPGEAQCHFARTCNGGDGVWAPFVFCSKRFSTRLLVGIISPIIILWLVLLFRMLGSTAEDFFSPALEMFSLKLGLPPRFAGVTLLALGNGAADVSATISAITGDPQNGYMLSLGALTGAAMFIGTVVAATVVIASDGAPCRGALVRDVTALMVAILVVWRGLSSGIVNSDTITLFLSVYVIFVVLVLVADVYHRAVVLPRRVMATQEMELERQMEEERQVTIRHTNPLDSVITALSNYDKENTQDGWTMGVESEQLQDQPVLLHGSHGVLAKTHGATHADGADASQNTAAYSMLDDAVDNVCIAPGSLDSSPNGWKEAILDGKAELMSHFATQWDDIAWNGDLHPIDKFFLICEWPFMLVRKITVPIPCEGYYVRPLIALSLALAPLWFAFYLYHGNGVNVFGFWTYYLAFWLSLIVTALAVLRMAPGGEGNMTMAFAAPIALFGFCIAATWIDTIADSLVSLLNFIGIILNIPSTILGLTLLAWGNSMSDLSANVTMARKGLGNMAMTACFAGPVFNILVGLGLGFSTLAAQTGVAERQVSLSRSVITGFLFIILGTASILMAGLFFGKGRISKQYGYVSLGLYAIYVVTSISLQYSNHGGSN